MAKTTKLCALMASLWLASASSALAQSVAAPRIYVNVNVGAQPQQRTISSSSSFPAYDEVATVETDHNVSNGPYFDIGGGYKIWRDLTIGASYSMFSSSGSAFTVAQIPDPIVFGKVNTVTLDSDDLERKEYGFHIKASWFFAVSDKIDVSFSAGPSFVTVKQDLIVSGSIPPGTSTINLGTERQSKTGVGVNVGFDGNYMFTPHYGVGLFVQYAGGKVDLPSAENVDFGGFQGGFGARIRF